MSYRPQVTALNWGPVKGSFSSNSLCRDGASINNGFSLKQEDSLEANLTTSPTWKHREAVPADTHKGVPEEHVRAIVGIPFTVDIPDGLLGKVFSGKLSKDGQMMQDIRCYINDCSYQNNNPSIMEEHLLSHLRNGDKSRFSL